MPAMMELIRDAVELTGAAPPTMLDDNSPVLTDAAITADATSIYLVGLIGGKEVGKSALVNALVGKQITPQTSHGPGTEIAIAYCHSAKQSAVRDLLDRQAPGKYRIVTHDIAALSRQVLVDLPDIDSRFSEHLELTRKMLRHMLFPIWVQSVEKYADSQPRQLLTKVAAGNDAGNFLFCLNKVDYLKRNAAADPNDDGPSEEAIEVRDDFAGRIASALKLPEPPRVFMISAISPEKYDLPALAFLLRQEKSNADVSRSQLRAGLQRQRTFLQWLDAQDFSGKSRRLARLADQAQETLGERIASPIVDSILPAITDDPAYRLLLADGVLGARAARWPLVNLIHTLLWPITYLVRQNIAPSAAPINAPAGTLTGASALVETHFAAPGGSVADLVQSAFAQLHQSNPDISTIYRHRRLWEPLHASAAAADLRATLSDTIRNQREAVMQKIAGRHGIIAPLFRWLLTIGAALWFPLLQPVLEAMLEPTGARTWRDIGLIAVHILGVTPLLQTAAFLLIYFLALWAWLQWDTQRRVQRLLSRWKFASDRDSELNLMSPTMMWIEELLSPITEGKRKVDAMIERIESERKAA